MQYGSEISSRERDVRKDRNREDFVAWLHLIYISYRHSHCVMLIWWLTSHHNAMQCPKEKTRVVTHAFMDIMCRSWRVRNHHQFVGYLNAYTRRWRMRMGQQLMERVVRCLFSGTLTINIEYTLLAALYFTIAGTMFNFCRWFGRTDATIWSWSRLSL